MTIWNKNYLGDQSQPWARQIQKEIDNQKAAFETADVNNIKRDAQLASSLRQVQAAAAEAGSAAAAAGAAADAAADAASEAGTAATNAQNAINGLIGLGTDDDTSVYQVNGYNIVAGTITATEISSTYIYSGTIDADQINAGILTGFTIRTSEFGRRIEMKGVDNSISFYDQDGNGLGHLAPARFGGTDYAIVLHRGPTSDPTSFDGPNVYLGQYNVSIQGDSDTGIIIGGLSPGLWSGEIALLFENELYIQNKGAGAFRAITNASGQLETEQGFRIAAGAMNIASGAQLNYAAPTSSSGVPAYIQTNNLVVRFSSSEQYKQQIKDIDFDYETLMSVPMKSFKFNADVERYGDEALTTYGYIAEDLHNAGLTDLVIYKRENGVDTPEAIQFHSLNAIYHQITKQHHDKINSLEQRIAALEGN